MIQRTPTSMMPQETIMDNLYEMFYKNLFNVRKLGWRIKCLNKQALKKEEEFNRYTEERILKAIEEKKKQQVFQKMPKKEDDGFSDHILPTEGDNSKSPNTRKSQSDALSQAVSQKVQPGLRRQQLIRKSDGNSLVGAHENPLTKDIEGLIQLKIGEQMDRTDPAAIKAA